MTPIYTGDVFIETIEREKQRMTNEFRWILNYIYVQPYILHIICTGFALKSAYNGF